MLGILLTAFAVSYWIWSARRSEKRRRDGRCGRCGRSLATPPPEGPRFDPLTCESCESKVTRSLRSAYYFFVGIGTLLGALMVFLAASSLAQGMSISWDQAVGLSAPAVAGPLLLAFLVRRELRSRRGGTGAGP
jgi:hypothetical protein